MAYASSLNISSGTLGVSQSWSISAESSAYTHTLTVKTTDGKYSTTILRSSTARSGSWTPPLAWAASNTTGKSVVLEFTLTTYAANGSKIGSRSRSLVFEIPESLAPSVSVSVSDAAGWEDTFGSYIRNKSKLKVVISATGAHGAAIKSYRATFNDRTYTAASFTTSVISASGHPTLSISVTDSRGYRSTTSVTVSVAAYENPAISALSVVRCSDASGNGTSGEFLKVTFDSTVFALDDLNTAEYVLKHKKTTEEEYTETTLTDFADQYSVSDGVFVFAADSSSSYNVTLTVTDTLGSGSKTAIGATGTKLFSVLGKGLGFAFGKIAELAGVLDIAFQTKFSGGVMHPVLEDSTDLDDVIIPNTYAGKNANSAGYLNLPFTSGTFTLTVEEAGDNGQMRQIVTLCDKKTGRVWERFYYGGAWGDWFCTSYMTGKVLWTGAHFMNGAQTITLAESISKQPSGAVFIWGWYNTSDNETVNAEFHHFFVPKYHTSNFEGKTVTMSDYYVGVKKQLYIYDSQVVGHPNNDKEGTDTLTGLKYYNNRLVLRAIVGV